jgi:hypothetical protein
VHLGSGDVEGALGLFGQALAVAGAVAPRNPQVVKALDNIAAAHRARGETEVAEKYSQHAREVEVGQGLAR